MTKTYANVMKQIESLKSEAEKLRKQEVSGVIARIRDAIKFYGLSAADLGLTGTRGGKRTAAAEGDGTPAPKKRGRPAKKAKTVVAAKYRDENGNTWAGRGKRPRWLKAQLDSGKQLADFLIK